MKALVVDDSRTMRDFLCMVLKDADFHTDEAANGLEALDMMKANPGYDLAIVDLNMPVMDGLTFFKRASLINQSAPPKYMMFTNENSPEILSQALLAGVNDFLMKPASAEMVMCKLRILGLIQ